MNIVKTYGNYIKKYAGTHPAVSHKMIDIGLHLEQFRTEHFAEKTMPKAYQKLNTLGVKNTLHALEYPESTVWCNLFAPVEIFQCFGLSALSMECLSRFSQDLRVKTILSTAQKAGELPPRSVPITKLLSVP